MFPFLELQPQIWDGFSLNLSVFSFSLLSIYPLLLIPPFAVSLLLLFWNDNITKGN